jgi:hypothetical protein
MFFVHMNGRIYDPLLGRFLSADLMVTNPGSLQSYNRYSYVGNNPLSLVDPSGFTEETPEQKEEARKRQEHNRKVENWINGGAAPTHDFSKDDAKAAGSSVTSSAESAQSTATPAKENLDHSGVTPSDGSKVSATSTKSDGTENALESNGNHEKWDARVNDGKVRDLSKTKDKIARAILDYFRTDRAANKMLRDGRADTLNGHPGPRKTISGDPIEVRRENAIYGFVRPDGRVVIKGTSQSLPEESGDTQVTQIPSYELSVVRGVPATPFVLHFHPWNEDTSGADFEMTRWSPNGQYVFTLPAATDTIEMVAPNEGPAAQGSQNLVGLP